MVAFTDDFNRANENLEDSADWNRVDGAAGAAAVVSNQLSFTSTTNTAYQAPTTGSGDHYGQAAYVADVAFSFPIAVRVFNSNNFIGFRWKDDGSREVWKRVLGTFTNLLDEPGGASAGEVYKLEWIGSTGQLFVDGGQLGGDMTASDLSGNQSPGVIVRNNEGITLDNWQSDAAAAGTTGTAALVLSNFKISAQGVMQPDGSAALVLSNMAIAGAGAQEIPGSAALNLSNMLLSASGNTGDVSGSAALVLSNMVLAASSDQTISGQGVLALANMKLAASGQSELNEGTATLVLANMVLAASGVETISGQAALNLSNMLLSGQGAHDAVGTAALQLGAYKLAAEAIGGESKESIAAVAAILRRRRNYP